MNVTFSVMYSKVWLSFKFRFSSPQQCHITTGGPWKVNICASSSSYIAIHLIWALESFGFWIVGAGSIFCRKEISLRPWAEQFLVPAASEKVEKARKAKVHKKILIRLERFIVARPRHITYWLPLGNPPENKKTGIGLVKKRDSISKFKS